MHDGLCSHYNYPLPQKQPSNPIACLFRPSHFYCICNIHQILILLFGISEALFIVDRDKYYFRKIILMPLEPTVWGSNIAKCYQLKWLVWLLPLWSLLWGSLNNIKNCSFVFVMLRAWMLGNSRWWGSSSQWRRWWWMAETNYGIRHFVTICKTHQSVQPHHDVGKKIHLEHCDVHRKVFWVLVSKTLPTLISWWRMPWSQRVLCACRR